MSLDSANVNVGSVSDFSVSSQCKCKTMQGCAVCCVIKRWPEVGEQSYFWMQRELLWCWIWGWVKVKGRVRPTTAGPGHVYLLHSPGPQTSSSLFLFKPYQCIQLVKLMPFFSCIDLQVSAVGERWWWGEWEVSHQGHCGSVDVHDRPFCNTSAAAGYIKNNPLTLFILNKNE